MSFDWKKTLGKVAPALATAFGGPMAGIAVNMAAQALGLGEGATEDDIANAVATGNPDVFLKLKQADAEFKVKMRELDVRVLEVDAGDRASARALGIAKGTMVQACLSVMVNVAFMTVLWNLFSGVIQIDPNMKDIVIYALGTLNALLIQSYNYWFGSTDGSKAKSAEMAKAMGK